MRTSGSLRFHIKKELKICLYMFLILSDSSKVKAKSRSSGGKSAVKSALPGLGKLSTNNLGSSSGHGGSTETGNAHGSAKTALFALKQSLMQGYDKGMRPVKNSTEVLEVEVDVIYRQVLDMDEKNQLLTSLIWYRQHWQDVYLQWDPNNHHGLEELWLPAETVWRPDIVLQEETGNKDYSPRLPFVKVNYNGHVEYHEPTSFTTTCSMNTMHFPFDVQHCTLTFSSWTHPGAKISVVPERRTEEMINDLQVFVNTGEWKLQHIEVEEQVSNYSEIMVESKSDYVNWPEVVFTITLRRNSSFYMQSMMFPSILLTSIALLGFFLPPDSGERVGLQITILLTFMVFLLTVCEMFPASTGPYLGVYYVICIFLLAVNLLMTVLVLQLYYHPCMPVPSWIRTFLYKIGRCCMFDVTELDEFKDFSKENKLQYRSAVASEGQRKSFIVSKSCLCNVMLSCSKKEIDDETSPSRDQERETLGHRPRLYTAPYSPPFNRSLPIKRIRQGRHCTNCPTDNLRNSYRERPILRPNWSLRTTGGRQEHQICKRSMYVKRDFMLERGGSERCVRYPPRYVSTRSCSHISKRRTQTLDDWPRKPSLEEKSRPKEEKQGPDDNNTMVEVYGKISEVLDSMKDVVSDVKVKNIDTEMENEWKKVALMMDKLFLRLYSAMLVISHVVIVGIAVFTSYSIEPHPQHLKAAGYLRQQGADDSTHTESH